MKPLIAIFAYVILILAALIAALFIGKTKMEGWQIVSIERPLTAAFFLCTLIAAILNK